MNLNCAQTTCSEGLHIELFPWQCAHLHALYFQDSVCPITRTRNRCILNEKALKRFQPSYLKKQVDNLIVTILRCAMESRISLKVLQGKQKTAPLLFTLRTMSKNKIVKSLAAHASIPKPHRKTQKFIRRSTESRVSSVARDTRPTNRVTLSDRSFH